MPAGTITALQVQERDKERVNVYLDGAFAVGVSLRTLQSAGLYKGKRLSEQDFAALQELEQADRAYDAALRFLEARPRSEREVRDRLRQRGFPDDHIQAAVARLSELGLLDDGAFARFWVENRQACRPRGAQALRAELRRKGVDAEVISSTIEERSQPEEEQARALTVGRGALRRHAGLDNLAFRRRMGAYLQRRGFSYDVIKPALATLWAELTGSAGEDWDDDLDQEVG